MADNELLGLYRQMFLIRRFEEESARAYAQGKIGGFLHLYIGQEAVAVGSIASMRPDDYIVTTYRDHGVALTRGMTSRACMAELFGKVTGCSKGFGGSMHMFDKEHHFLGGHGIVGAHVSLATGPAFKAKYMKEDRVTVCFFGDGATNIGGFHEGLSLASVWKLPIVFVCENNEYSMGTPLSRTAGQTDFSKKAVGYNMPGDRFDGHDVLLVRDRMKVAIDRARAGEGPSLIEIKTYRYRGHSMSDPGKYRTVEELEARKKQDPLTVMRGHMEKAKVDANAIAEVEASVEAEVEDCVKFADESPMPTEALMHELVYAPGHTDEEPALASRVSGKEMSDA